MPRMEKPFSYYLKRLKRKIVYRITLFFNIIRHYLMRQSWPWWSHVNEDIILGAIPLKNKGHLDALRHDINAVVTLLEPFEWTSQSPLSSPVTPEEWQQHEIAHLHIDAKDFVPLTTEQIESAVEFIREHIQKGGKVYVHCKAGRGRSATVVTCYLLKYGGYDSVSEALDFLRTRRPQIAINDSQRAAIEAYFQKVKR